MSNPLAIGITPQTRPNRFTQKKDELYHIQYGRYCVGAGMNHPANRNFIFNNIIYWNFYNGNQWILNEDLGAFLNDESGNARNRIRACENIIRPMVEQYIGNAIRMEFNAKAFNISPLSRTRRDEMLAEMLMNTQMAQSMPPQVAEKFKQQTAVGDTEQDTEEIFENIYVDKYVRDANNFLRWSKEHNEFNQSVKLLAKYLAIEGVCVHRCMEQNGWNVWEVQDPSYWFFDRGAKRPDLKDSHFMGDFWYALPTDIYEAYQDISQPQRDIIENYSISNTDNTWNSIYGVAQDRVPVVRVFWKDCEKQEWGFVMEDGYETFVQINEAVEGEQKPKYTDKDLIIPKTEEYRIFIGKGKKRNKFVDQLRYCIFTPAEITGGVKGKDICYEWGVVPYQQTDYISPANIEFPYKCNTWNYHEGEIHSPIQDIISPQRMLNRGRSAADAIINNSRLAGTVISKNGIDAQGGEEELNRSMNQGKPVIVDDRGMGVQNVVGTYGANSATSINPFMDYVSRMRESIQNITGVNEAMQGMGGANDLVGVTESRLAQGSLIQENFYDTLAHVMLQTYQTEMSVGLRIYADSKRRLSLMIGDEEADEIIISNKMLAEQFRVFIKRVAPDSQQKAEAYQLGLQLFQLGVLGDKQLSELMLTGNVDDIGRLMNQYRREKMFAQRKAQEQQNKILAEEAAQKQALIQKEEAMIAKEDQKDLYKHDTTLANKLQQKELGNQGKIESDLLQIKGDDLARADQFQYDMKLLKAQPKPPQQTSR